jgi:hypothetical protein
MKKIKEPKYKIGTTLMCDDGGEGNAENFVLGVIVDYDVCEDGVSYEIQWIDEDVNGDADKYFEEDKVKLFVTLYRDILRGKVQNW